MRFMVNRASRWQGQPCEGARLEKYRHLEIRGSEDGKGQEMWEDREGWFMDFPDLPSLLSFVETEGRIVLDWRTEPGICGVTIYDDYIE